MNGSTSGRFDVMNNPRREEWMSYLYDELDTTTRAGLAEHCRTCADCRASVEHWRAARSELDAWRLAPRAKSRRAQPVWSAPRLKWATMATALLAGGFG